MQDLKTEELGWRNMCQYQYFRKIQEEEEVYLCNFEGNQILESKIRETDGWKKNGVYEKVNDVGQKAISTRWFVTEKLVNGKIICKALLAAKGFKERGKDMNTDAPTRAPDTLKLYVAKIAEMGWNIQFLDIKTAYLQGYATTY